MNTTPYSYVLCSFCCFLFSCLTGRHCKDGLGRLGRAEHLVHQQEHDDGQQRREDGAQQVVRAAVLGHGHHLGNHVADQVHPRDGRAEGKAGNDKVGGLAGKLGGNLGNAHCTVGSEKSWSSSGTKGSAWTIVAYLTVDGSSSSLVSSSTT